MTGLMEGRRGLIMGLANDRSLAWASPRSSPRPGPSWPFLPGRSAREARAPLAESLGSDFLIDCDVSDMAALDTAFAKLAARWPTIDFVYTRSAFSDKNELRGKYVDTSLDNFLRP